MSTVIGITGGIGAGKSTILNILRQDYHAHVIIADEVSHRLMRRGGASYQALRALLGDEILTDEGEICHAAMATKIFADPALLADVNAAVHPLVLQAIEEELAQCRQNGTALIAVETALLTKGALDCWCDTVWYVYVPVRIREKRLMEGRGYSKEKCADIMSKQASDADYRAYADAIIDNSGTPEHVRAQIQALLSRLTERST